MTANDYMLLGSVFLLGWQGGWYICFLIMDRKCRDLSAKLTVAQMRHITRESK